MVLFDVADQQQEDRVFEWREYVLAHEACYTRIRIF